MRADIWRLVFPAKKITEDLDIDKLARFNITGGNIRNTDMNAAFLAADCGEPKYAKALLETLKESIDQYETKFHSIFKEDEGKSKRTG